MLLFLQATFVTTFNCKSKCADKMKTFYVLCHKPGYKHHGRHFWSNDQGTEDGMKGKMRLERSQHDLVLLCLHPLKCMKKVSEVMFIFVSR